ncbi:alpha/beta fold hydrolase [Streptomyces sp. NPDC058202]|uniref:alpha/beta fold hydrolase n=1 Tax=Streptomyces sp. NPDC058202 TaxID=3346380 RepID=UPI0036E25148
MTSVTHGKPTILLVHGAWHGAWCWDKLVPELTAQGWHAITIDLPSASADAGSNAGMYDDARAIRERLDSIDGPVTVLAHSYGGLPATEAAAQAPNVSHLVYLSAFQLNQGDSLASQSAGQLPSGDAGTLPVPDSPAKHLYADVSADEAAHAAERLRPQTIRSFSEPLTDAAWNTITSSYIICEQDEILPVAFQEAMASRADRTHRLPSSHSPFLSMPAELARLITATVARA